MWSESSSDEDDDDVYPKNQFIDDGAQESDAEEPAVNPICAAIPSTWPEEPIAMVTSTIQFPTEIKEVVDTAIDELRGKLARATSEKVRKSVGCQISTLGSIKGRSYPTSISIVIQESLKKYPMISCFSTWNGKNERINLGGLPKEIRSKIFPVAWELDITFCCQSMFVSLAGDVPDIALQHRLAVGGGNEAEAKEILSKSYNATPFIPTVSQQGKPRPPIDNAGLYVLWSYRYRTVLSKVCEDLIGKGSGCPIRRFLAAADVPPTLQTYLAKGIPLRMEAPTRDLSIHESEFVKIESGKCVPTHEYADLLGIILYAIVKDTWEDGDSKSPTAAACLNAWSKVNPSGYTSVATGPMEEIKATAKRLFSGMGLHSGTAAIFAKGSNLLTQADFLTSTMRIRSMRDMIKNLKRCGHDIMAVVGDGIFFTASLPQEYKYLTELQERDALDLVKDVASRLKLGDFTPMIALDGLGFRVRMARGKYHSSVHMRSGLDAETYLNEMDLQTQDMFSSGEPDPKRQRSDESIGEPDPKRRRSDESTREPDPTRQRSNESTGEPDDDGDDDGDDDTGDIIHPTQAMPEAEETTNDPKVEALLNTTYNDLLNRFHAICTWNEEVLPPPELVIIKTWAQHVVETLDIVYLSVLHEGNKSYLEYQPHLQGSNGLLKKVLRVNNTCLDVYARINLPVNIANYLRDPELRDNIYYTVHTHKSAIANTNKILHAYLLPRNIINSRDLKRVLIGDGWTYDPKSPYTRENPESDPIDAQFKLFLHIHANGQIIPAEGRYPTAHTEGVTREDVNNFLSECKKYYSKKEFSHPAYGTLFSYVLEHQKYGHVAHDYFYTDVAPSGKPRVILDEKGHPCRRPPCEEVIGLNGDTIVDAKRLNDYIWNNILEDHHLYHLEQCTTLKEYLDAVHEHKIYLAAPKSWCVRGTPLYTYKRRLPIPIEMLKTESGEFDPRKLTEYVWGPTKTYVNGVHGLTRYATSTKDYISIIREHKHHTKTEWILRGAPLEEMWSYRDVPWDKTTDVMDRLYPFTYTTPPAIIDKISALLNENDGYNLLEPTSIVELVELLTPEYVEANVPDLSEEIGKYRSYVTGKRRLFTPDMSLNVRKLLTMDIGISFGQHFDESVSSLRHGMPISTACFGDTETGKGTKGETLKNHMLEWKRELLNIRNGAHATAELRRPDNASLYKVAIISDMKDPLESLLPFRQLNDGLTINPKFEKGVDTHALGPEFIKADCPALVMAGQNVSKIIQSPLPTKLERYTADVCKAICRRIMYIPHKKITWEKNALAKLDPLIIMWQFHFLALFCHWRLVEEMRANNGKDVTSIYPDVHRYGEAPCPDGLLTGWSRQLEVDAMKCRDDLLADVGETSSIMDWIKSHIMYEEGAILPLDYITKSIQQVTRQNGISNMVIKQTVLALNEDKYFDGEIIPVGIGRSGQNKRKLICTDKDCNTATGGSKLYITRCKDHYHRSKKSAVLINAVCDYEFIDYRINAS